MNHGKRQILGVFGDPVQSITKNRIAGFSEALINYSIDPEDSYLANSHLASFEKELNQKMDQRRWDAIFMMSDELLVNTFPILKKRNLAIPEDIAMIAISDGKAPFHTFPFMTHIKHSGYEIGRHACKLLLSYIESKSYSVEHHKLSTQLVELHSV